jgi:ribosome-binding protein aMBF1 (putative translation factor)
MSSVFESIKQGLNEAIEYERGDTQKAKVDRTASNLRVAMMAELAHTRAEKGISQKELEEMSGVKQPVIARMEKGRTSPQIDTVLRVLAPLGKTLAVVPLEK